MPRIALGLEYDGCTFSGWQSQDHSLGVQQVVETALTKVAAHPVSVIAAGRTDAGVHAAMQVVHFDSDAQRSERSWMLGANTNMPEQVSVLWAREVPAAFHARYSAVTRTYRYYILNRLPRAAIGHQRMTWVRQPLDAARMHLAAQHLLGEHDFSSFRAAECQSRTPMRCVYDITVERHGDCVTVLVTANAFLHHMVRNIVGVLIAVGRGEEDIDWPRQILAVRDRKQGGVTAPAAGLYLIGIRYAEALALPSLRVGAPGWY